MPQLKGISELVGSKLSITVLGDRTEVSSRLPSRIDPEENAVGAYRLSLEDRPRPKQTVRTGHHG